MATIVKTKAGTWKSVVRKKGWPTTSKTFRTKRDAVDWARQTEDQIVRGIYVERMDSHQIMFAAALDRYLAEVTPTKRVSTQRSEVLRAKALNKYFGKYSLAAIGTDLVARYRDERLATPSKRARSKDGPRGTLSASTVRLELALLGHVFTTAIKEWRIGIVVNPVSNIRKPSAGEGRNRRLRPEEEVELLQAVDAYSNPMLGWIVRIALETGMRSGEITGLRLGDVDTARRLVHLSDTKNNSSRTVPMTRAAKAVFDKARDNPMRPPDCDLLFFGEVGKNGARHPYTFNPAWLKIKRSLGLADLRFHDLRHEAVSRLVEAGLSDQEVASISGHKSMQMLKRYTHLRAEDLIGKLDASNLGDRSQ